MSHGVFPAFGVLGGDSLAELAGDTSGDLTRSEGTEDTDGDIP